eukprot:TRINITY_DN17095_c0_g1_i2.p2 TRINITY_DN17095_c0_g1~~TRINITY_DN17095_c0_g1_i2.p2  ORF type:complete len:147 (-),score=48.08 TRINITY_DN17095_c0_g1_i2:134-574(-)
MEFQAQLDAELPFKIEKAIAQKEKELKLKYKRQLELDRKSCEAKAKANYEANISNEIRKFEAEQAEFARKKIAYNNMVHHFEKQRKEMSAKLRESKLILIKKQVNSPFAEALSTPFAFRSVSDKSPKLSSLSTDFKYKDTVGIDEK